MALGLVFLIAGLWLVGFAIGLRAMDFLVALHWGKSLRAPAPPQPQPQASNYWHYCRNPEGYYPYVKNCPEGWLQVAPQPDQ